LRRESVSLMKSVAFRGGYMRLCNRLSNLIPCVRCNDTLFTGLRCAVELLPLPDAISRLVNTLSAPPRLVAHLTLVHDSASQIATRFTAAWPELTYDRHAVLLGAAVHDVGKILFPSELSQTGHEHERAGEELLRSLGFPAELARLARTHAQWAGESPLVIEDLMVALADKLWRGRRDDVLEVAFCDLLAERASQERWQIFVALDDIATALAVRADERLSWQNQHAI